MLQNRFRHKCCNPSHELHWNVFFYELFERTKKMRKAEVETRAFDKTNIPRLKREISEIESKLKTDGSELDKRTVKLLNSRLFFLKEQLEYLGKIDPIPGDNN